MYTDSNTQSTPPTTTFTYVDVGNSFISAYYKTLTTDIDTLYNFYEENASIVRVDELCDEPDDSTAERSATKSSVWSSRDSITGQLNIHKITQLIGQCKCKINTVDYVSYNNNELILIQVTGVMLLDTVDRTFTQSFLLVATTDTSYAIRNDILRFLKNNDNVVPQQNNDSTRDNDNVATSDNTVNQHVTADNNNEVNVVNESHAIDTTGDIIQSPTKSMKSIKSPDVQSTSALNVPEQADELKLNTTAQSDHVNGIDTQQQSTNNQHESTNQLVGSPPVPTTRKTISATPSITLNTTSDNKKVSPPATATDSNRPAQSGKVSTWAALVRPTNNMNTNNNNESTVTPIQSHPPNKSMNKTNTAAAADSTASVSDSKSNDVSSGKRDVRGYRPTGFWGKPSAEQVASSIVVNAVPDSITHDQLREVCVDKFGRVRHLHQPQNKQFVVVYFIDIDSVDTALSTGSINVNGIKLTVSENTYNPNLSTFDKNRYGDNTQTTEKTNFASRGRGFIPSRGYVNKPNNKSNGTNIRQQ